MAQKGYISLVLIVFALVFAVVIFPFKFPSQNLLKSDGFQYCREFITDPNSQTISVPNKNNGTELSTYKLIKQNVPIRPRGFQGEHHIIIGGVTVVNGKNFQIYYPTPDNGRSYDFNTEDGKTDISFIDFGLIFLRHLTDAGTPEVVPGTTGTSTLEIMDIYQDITKPPLPEAENILKCVDEGTESVVDPVVLVPDQKISEKKEQLQLEWFLIRQTKLLPKAWWTPECKPAIYLYPTQKQLVNVKVNPKGELGYTDPVYPDNGWTVSADPYGRLYSMNHEPITNNYLYYESKLLDSEIKKPKEGWVVKNEELEKLYEELLPKLGLNVKEANDFSQYWLKTLPYSPYYFVGLVDKNQRDYLEPLTVTPNPDSSIRFSLYFEALDMPVSVSKPAIITPVRTGFTLVDWGGIVKLHPDTPFTCSQ